MPAKKVIDQKKVSKVLKAVKSAPAKKKASKKPLKSFEDCLDDINQIIGWSRHKWRLTSLAWMDFEDVSQQIRIHIYKKWSLWNQDLPLRPWISRIVSNQMINMVRNHYTIYARPCVTCPHNIGGNYCDLYGVQDSSCDLYAKWEAGKRVAHEINNPVSIHSTSSQQNFNANGDGHHDSEMQIEDTKSGMSNIGDRVEGFHALILTRLNTIQAKVYKILFMEHKSEEEAAKLMGYYTKEENRTPGYKQIKNLKKQIIKIAKEVAYE